MANLEHKTFTVARRYHEHRPADGYLVLNIADEVLVLYSDNDGWCHGHEMFGGVEGWFPRSILGEEIGFPRRWEWFVNRARSIGAPLARWSTPPPDETYDSIPYQIFDPFEDAWVWHVSPRSEWKARQRRDAPQAMVDRQRLQRPSRRVRTDDNNQLLYDRVMLLEQRNHSLEMKVDALEIALRRFMKTAEDKCV